MAKQADTSQLTTVNVADINDNFDAVNTALDNTLSRDGSTPNSMEADLDMNSNDILNANNISANSLSVGGSTIINNTDLTQLVIPDWRGQWVTATAYQLNDLVKEGGNVYICVEAHTSGVWATDLTSCKWELFVEKGQDGDGIGDLLSTNNLSDVASATTSLQNLGGGTVGINIFRDNTAADVRTEISAQQQDDILDDLAGLTQATNKIPYFDSATTAATLDLLDEDNMASDSDTGVPTQQSVKAYVDSAVSGGGGIIGSGQSWQDFTTARSTSGSGFSHQNTTGAPIMVYVDYYITAGLNGVAAQGPQVSTNNSTWVSLGSQTPSGAGEFSVSVNNKISFIVPNNHYYRVYFNTMIGWQELR